MKSSNREEVCQTKGFPSRLDLLNSPQSIVSLTNSTTRFRALLYTWVSCHFAGPHSPIASLPKLGPEILEVRLSAEKKTAAVRPDDL